MIKLLPAAFGLLLAALSGSSALAQTATSAAVAPVPLPTHTIRTIDPADADFTDLEFLRQEIGGARVVMLGEPTHGVGNATAAKIRLMRFLKERMGFTTVAFESGFYDLDRAGRQIEAGTRAATAVAASVYPVWTQTQEFQAMLPLLEKGGLRVAGFDSQIGFGSDDMLEELEAFLKPEKGAAGIAYDYLDECLSMMREHSIFPPANSLVLFNLQIGKARKLLEKIAKGPDARRRERAEFWLQNLRSVQATAHDYATNDPAVKDSASFKAADSNPRDAQMADNLLWYLRQHPQEKVLCWGALGHLSGKVSGLESEELARFRPMGQTVKAALGNDAVYVLSTLAGGGTHGFGYWGKHLPVPVPAPGSVEADLLVRGQDYSFISLKHDAPGRRLTTSAFEFQPITGPWSEAVDGLLFLKTINPPHPATAIAAPMPQEDLLPDQTPATRPGLGRRNPAQRPTAANASGVAFPLSGSVLDRKTGQPVPFATVAVPTRSAGTITDAQGRFQLEVCRGELVQVSSIGYEPTALAAAPGAAATVQLVPAAFALTNVRVSAQSQDPKRIMKKVIQAMPQNYDLGEQTARVYEHRQISNFDTVRLDGEFVMNMLVPIGFQQYQTFLRQQPFPEVRVQEARFPVRPPASAKFDVASISGHGMTKDKLDVIRLSKLFKAGSLNRYVFRLDTLLRQGAETTYVIAFQAKKANKRTIGSDLQAGYQGRLFVLQSNYAVTRYEALWQGDTAWYNAAANKYHGRNNIAGRIFVSLYTDWRNAHVATYTKWPDGRYRLTTSTGSARALGRNFKTGPFYYQSECFFFFQPLPDDAIAPAQTLGVMGETAQGLLQQEHLEFWQTYQRPVPVESVPVLEAGK